MRLAPLHALTDNYIWTLVADDGQAIVVDPGEAAPVFEAAASGLQPAAVLLTHHHPDHVGGVPDLLARWPSLPVFGPADDRIATVTSHVGDGGHVAWGPWRFDVLAVPGHTVSHIAFHGHGVLFCGDTLFSLGCGRMFEGTPAQMLASLERLAALPGVTRVCCGHEYTQSNAAFARTVDPDNAALRRRSQEVDELRSHARPTLPSTLADELATNPFLRVASPAVRARVARLCGGAEPAGPVETFAALRRAKDAFRA